MLYVLNGLDGLRLYNIVDNASVKYKFCQGDLIDYSRFVLKDKEQFNLAMFGFESRFTIDDYKKNGEKQYQQEWATDANKLWIPCVIKDDFIEFKHSYLSKGDCINFVDNDFTLYLSEQISHYETLFKYEVCLNKIGLPHRETLACIVRVLYHNRQKGLHWRNIKQHYTKYRTLNKLAR